MKIKVTFIPSEYEAIEWYTFTDNFWVYNSDGLEHIITKFFQPTKWR